MTTPTVPTVPGAVGVGGVTTGGAVIVTVRWAWLTLPSASLAVTVTA